MKTTSNNNILKSMGANLPYFKNRHLLFNLFLQYYDEQYLNGYCKKYDCWDKLLNNEVFLTTARYYCIQIDEINKFILDNFYYKDYNTLVFLTQKTAFEIYFSCAPKSSFLIKLLNQYPISFYIKIRQLKYVFNVIRKLHWIKFKCITLIVRYKDYKENVTPFLYLFNNFKCKLIKKKDLLIYVYNEKPQIQLRLKGTDEDKAIKAYMILNPKFSLMGKNKTVRYTNTLSSYEKIQE